MKHTKWLCLLTVLVMGLLGCAGALAEEKVYTGQLELFSAGDLPEVVHLPQTYATDDLKDYLLEQLLNSAAAINVAGYKMLYSEMKAVLQELANTHPELFNLTRSYSMTLTGNLTVREIRPGYKYTGEELAKWTAIYNAGVRKIVDYAKTADTDLGRVMLINDYLCAHYAYDEEYGFINSPELMFEYGVGKCQAYMLAYCAALNELGIHNLPVTSPALNHAWNLVYLDGDWYHTDATWNDPLNNCPLRANHNHMLLSDDAIYESGHYVWSAAERALNTQYDDAFWRDLYQAVPMVDDVIYYLDSDEDIQHPTVRSHDLKTGEGQSLFTFDAPAYSEHGAHPIWATRSRLIYAVDHKVYTVPQGGGEASVLFEIGEDEHIWAVFLEGDMLHLFAAETPYSDGVIYQMMLSEAHDLLLSPRRLDVQLGETAQLHADVQPVVNDGAEHLHWQISDPTVAAVDSEGRVEGLKMGAAWVTVDFDEILFEKALVVVHAPQALKLPVCLQTIEAEAFLGAAAEEIILPEGARSIGSRAFADCAALKMVELPQSILTIADDAFENTMDVVLLCASDVAAAYAQAHGMPYVMTVME